MPRADAFDDFYGESHERLLHQVYAYAGVTEVAQRALTEAYVDAAQHWRSVSNGAPEERDAWVRSRAITATARRRNRSRQPWYVSARGTADENRRLLATLGEVPPAERHLFVAATVAGLDRGTAAREAGVADSDAPSSLDRTTDRLRNAGVDTSPGSLQAALDRLRDDLRHDPVQPASRIRRDGDRRRHSYQLLACAAAAAVAVGAGVWISTSGGDETAAPDTGHRTTTPRTDPPSTVQPAPEVSRAALAEAASVTGLGGHRHWRTVSTSSDLGATTPPDPCLTTVPDTASTDHYWVRQFATGKAARADGGGHAGGSHQARRTAIQTLEVASSRPNAQTSYAAQVAAFGVCQAGAHRLVSVTKLHGVADLATVLDLQYVDRSGLHGELVTIARSGAVVTAWIVREPAAPAPRTRPVVRLLAASVAAVCRLAHGSCPERPYRTTPVAAPPDPAAPGFLSTVDLPLFSEVANPWAATTPASARDNPSATSCDQADFIGAGAVDARSRSYVIPFEGSLPDSFGLSETVGAFGSRQEADGFVDTVSAAVAACPARNPTLTVLGSTDITPDRGRGVVWRIDLQTSSTTTQVYRMGLVRVGDTVAQVTFTPSSATDVGSTAYAVLVTRAADRLSQL